MSKYFLFLIPCLALFSNRLVSLETASKKTTEAIESAYQANNWKNLYYDVLPKVINENQFITILEVGVAFGGHAKAILSQTAVEHYYGVDPYQANYDTDDSFCKDVARYSREAAQKNFDALYNWVKTVQLQPFQGRFDLVRLPSVKAATQFDNESIDCIFIDGDHRYQPALDDLNAWYPIVKQGGILLGDDYWMKPVADAVNDFCRQNQLSLFFFTSKAGHKIWAIRK